MTREVIIFFNISLVLFCDLFVSDFRGKVHKHTVIAFCEKKIKEARISENQVDLEGFVLLWEFLILLLRQNGVRIPF